MVATPDARTLVPIGRQQELQQISHLLLRKQSVSVVGPPGIGKTTLLRYLVSVGLDGRARASPQTVVPVWLAGERLADVDEAGFYRALFRQTEPAVANSAIRSSSEPSGFRDARRWLRSVKRANADLIVVLDHFEQLAGNPALDANFFGGLRSLVADFDVSYLTASASPLSELPYADPQTAGSPFFNVFRQLSLDPLTAAESRQVVTLLSPDLPAEIVTFVVDLAGGIPRTLTRATELARERWHGNNNHWSSTDNDWVTRQLQR